MNTKKITQIISQLKKLMPYIVSVKKETSTEKNTKISSQVQKQMQDWGQTTTQDQEKKIILDENKVFQVYDHDNTPREKQDFLFKEKRFDLDQEKSKTDKFIDNMNAILTLKQVEAEQRDFTDFEREMLAKYTSWGGLANYVNPSSKNSNWDIIKKLYDNLPEHEKYNYQELRLKAKQKIGYLSLESLDMALVYAILSPQEYQDAYIATPNAHYTHKIVISQMWNLLQIMGYKGGKMLETSAGTGLFLGLMTKNLRERTQVYAVELESTSSKILKALYPNAQVLQNTNFGEAKLPYGSFNLVVGNPPFGSNKLTPYDTQFPQLRGFSLHNYFIGKSLMSLREGGLCLVVTSQSTMDSGASLEFRKWVISTAGGNADFLGAIRLPSNAFEKNAGTSVTTDIILLKKRGKNGVPHPKAQNFVNTYNTREVEYTYQDTNNKTQTETRFININEYYANNDKMILGEMLFAFENGGKGLYRDDEQICIANKNRDFSADLKQAISWLANDLGELAQHLSVEEMEASTISEGIGEIVIKRGKAYKVDAYGGKRLIPLDELFDFPKINMLEMVEHFYSMSNLLEMLFNAERNNNFSDAEVENYRKNLNNFYDDFVKKYGNLTNPKNLLMSVFRDAPTFSTLEFLENNNRGIITKADIFQKRQFYAVKTKMTAQNLGDALQMSIHHKGNINIDFMAGLLGLKASEVKNKILTQKIPTLIDGKTFDLPLAFVNPSNNEIIEAEEYLSGNVREKLANAKAYVLQNKGFEINVEALEYAQPTDLKINDIFFSLSSTYIPVSIHEDFAKTHLKIRCKILRNVSDENILVNIDELDNDTKTPENKKAGIYFGRNERKSEYELKNGKKITIEQLPIYTKLGHHLLESCMSNKLEIIERYKVDENGNLIKKNYKGELAMEQDDAMTNEVLRKKQELERAFKSFISQNLEYVRIIEQNYNEVFNATRVRAWQDTNFAFPNANPNIKLRPHQKKVVRRALHETIGGFHGVGSGKTFAIITTAMEMRRLGIAKKPMIVVQNATLEQFIKDVRKLYPQAKILVPNLSLQKEDRIRLFNRIAFNDYDMIIVPQSQFTLIPDNPIQKKQLLQERIDEYMELIYDLKKTNDSADKFQIKSLENEVKKINLKIDEVNKTIYQEILENAGTNSTTKGNKSNKTKDIARAVIAMDRKLQKQLDRKTDDVRHFDKMGIDALLIDEFHAYKRIGFTTKLQKVAGIDTAGSERALSTLLKIRAIYDYWGQEKNVSCWTGTPISNTMAEFWTMIKFIRPSALKAVQCLAFDGFVNNFCEVVQSFEMDAGGRYRTINRLAKFKNFPELQKLWRSCADVVLSNDVLGKNKDASDEQYFADWGQNGVYDKLPLLKKQNNGKRGYNTHIINISIPQRKQIKLFREFLDAYKAMTGEKKRENRHIPLLVFNNAKRATIDLRLVSSVFALPDLQYDKLNKSLYCAEIALDIYERENREGNKNATQLIFCDSFQNAVTGFNVFEEIKKILTQNGVPEHEIVIIQEAEGKKRDKVFEDVTVGKVRFLLGSTEKMGVGVNVQKNLIALHHIDAPLRPMDFEQRNGRILRQGNTNKEIQILTYGIEKTLDAVAYKRLEIKQNFINSVMLGDVKGRVVEDEIDIEGGSFFENLSSVLSGSNTALKYMEAKKERQNKEAEYGYINHQIQQEAKEIINATNQIKTNTKKITEYTKFREKVKAETYPIDENFTIRNIVLADGQVFDENSRKEVRSTNEKGETITKKVKYETSEVFAIMFGRKDLFQIDENIEVEINNISLIIKNEIYSTRYTILVKDYDVNFEFMYVDKTTSDFMAFIHRTFRGLESDIKKMRGENVQAQKLIKTYQDNDYTQKLQEISEQIKNLDNEVFVLEQTLKQEQKEQEEEENRTLTGTKTTKAHIKKNMLGSLVEDETIASCGVSINGYAKNEKFLEMERALSRLQKLVSKIQTQKNKITEKNYHLEEKKKLKEYQKKYPNLRMYMIAYPNHYAKDFISANNERELQKALALRNAINVVMYAYEGKVDFSKPIVEMLHNHTFSLNAYEGYEHRLEQDLYWRGVAFGNKTIDSKKQAEFEKNYPNIKIWEYEAYIYNKSGYVDLAKLGIGMFVANNDEEANEFAKAKKIELQKDNYKVYKVFVKQYPLKNEPNKNEIAFLNHNYYERQKAKVKELLESWTKNKKH